MMSEQIFNIKFVGEVKKRPLLYDFNHPCYLQKDFTEDAWCEVGNEVKMTAPECKERWKNLRAVFVRNMKPALSGSGSKKRKPYYLTEAMQFTIPYVKALSTVTTGNLPNVSQEEEYELSDDIDTKEGIEKIEDSLILLPSQPTPSPPTPPIPTPAITKQEVNTQTEERNQVDKTFTEYFKAKKPKLDGTPSRSESLKMFLLSMLPDLELMTDKQIREFKRKSLQTIDDILNSSPTCSPKINVNNRNF